MPLLKHNLLKIGTNHVFRIRAQGKYGKSKQEMIYKLENLKKRRKKKIKSSQK